MNDPRVALAICMRNQVSSSFILAFLELRYHPNIRTYVFGKGTLLPMARNQVLNQLDLNIFTHVLMIDDDMSKFTQAHLSRLLELDLDVVGATCVLKEPPHQVAGQLYNPQAMITELENQDINARKPQEAKAIGTAFVLIKTEVLRKTYEETSEGEKLWFTMDRMQRINIKQDALQIIKQLPEYPTEDDYLDLVQFGIDAHKGTPLLGEDISFCWNVKQAGFKIWIDPGTVIAHIGEYEYDIKDAEQWNQLSSQEQDRREQVLLRVYSKD